eukprot:TRINITY_DN6488_c1_g2_i3.p1 TRINITY_DN6488_c1_g2~~TRINITY_DN6488_c1_g2_i3.p1  ORF type:complete len:639 (+),score=301.01 TRINITY_DN6488_c1_g2_i3:182-2098(+)
MRVSARCVAHVALQYRKVSIDPWKEETISEATLKDLQFNIDLCRDAIIAFSASGSASGYGGHSGGAFDSVPEVVIIDAFFRGRPDKFVPIFFDEAGHRVVTQYLISAIRGDLPAEKLYDYRRGYSRLPGHPELGMTPGVQFSSGRLGHMWPFVNGVALANPGKVVICLGSDGSQQEGNDAEAARLAVAKNLNVKVIVDDNDITITGHPSQYMPGYDVHKTFEGHGMSSQVADGEDLAALVKAMREQIALDKPAGVVVRRQMAPGIPGVEGTSVGHDVIPVAKAIDYLTKRGHTDAAEILKTVPKAKAPKTSYLGCGEMAAMRSKVGDVLVGILSKMSEAERKASVMAIDSDLGSSTSLMKLAKFPEIFVHSGIMERGNFSAAAGFGMEKGRQGIFSTFAAFLEMIISEVTMARLNNSNVLCHFSHSGVDDMADNTCHFGINNMFADNGLPDDDTTRLYFPCDVNQVAHLLPVVYDQPGLRFLFTTRSKTPVILKEDNETPFYGPDYKFESGKDDVIREGTDGYVMSFGDALYRSLDAVEALRKEGINVGLINKTTLNVVDEDVIRKVAKGKFLLIVEPFNTKTGLGARYGTWLMTRGLFVKYAHIGVHREGAGGLWEHAYHQKYDSESVQEKIRSLLA